MFSIRQRPTPRHCVQEFSKTVCAEIKIKCPGVSVVRSVRAGAFTVLADMFTYLSGTKQIAFRKII